MVLVVPVTHSLALVVLQTR